MNTPPVCQRANYQYVARLIRTIKAFGLRGLIKTLYANFRLLPLRYAIRLPILLSRHTVMYRCRKGCIEFESDTPKIGSLRFGLNDLEYSYESHSFISIQGKMIIKGSGTHVFGPGVSLNVWKDGILTIGNNFSVAPHLRMFVSNKIEIGDNNMWSFYNLVMDTDAHPIFNNEGEIINHPEKITFGDKCWLGAYCKILKGADIPNGAIIGAGSTLTGPLAIKNSIYVGNRLLKENIRWEPRIL